MKENSSGKMTRREGSHHSWYPFLCMCAHALFRQWNLFCLLYIMIIIIQREETNQNRTLTPQKTKNLLNSKFFGQICTFPLTSKHSILYELVMCDWHSKFYKLVRCYLYAIQLVRCFGVATWGLITSWTVCRAKFSGGPDCNMAFRNSSWIKKNTAAWCLDNNVLKYMRVCAHVFMTGIDLSSFWFKMPKYQ